MITFCFHLRNPFISPTKHKPDHEFVKRSTFCLRGENARYRMAPQKEKTQKKKKMEHDIY